MMCKCDCTNILASTSITSEANDIDIVVPSRTIYNGQCEKLLIQMEMQFL